ncbi:MAG: DUF790 family protein [Thermoproteota archaeon]
MLPSNLLRARVSRGHIFPIYAELDLGTLTLAERIVKTFEGSVGRRKGELKQRLREFEDEDFDYRLVRGLSTLLERRCIFEAETPIDPKKARMMVFEESSRAKVVSIEDRKIVIDNVAAKLGIDSKTIEEALYSDVEEELMLKKFDPVSPDTLIKYYNLSLTQTLLFRSLRMNFTASGNWKRIFRAMKRLGLMYSIERDGGGYIISVDGPLSLFKMTDRYGTLLAKLLPQIVAAESWTAKAEIIAKSKNRIYEFELSSNEAKGIVGNMMYKDSIEEKYDSTVEERFATSFNSHNSGWVLKREPEPLLAGRNVLIPDFSFEKSGMKTYLEIVGFWTQDYLDRKVRKLNSIVNVDILLAVNESLACSKIQNLKGPIIYYKKEVPVKPILDHLKRREALFIEMETQELKIKRVRLDGDIVSLEDIARKHNISIEAVKKALQNIDFDGYRKVGLHYVSDKKFAELRKRLSNLEKLADALEAIEEYGISNPYEVLEALGYTVVWEGLNFEKSKIMKHTN